MSGVATESEIRRIEADLREPGWAEHARLEREAPTWTRLANRVNACVMTVDDFTNDLSRDYLSSAIGARRVVMSARVAQASELFLASTVEEVDASTSPSRAQDGCW